MKFILNDELIETEQPAGMVLADFIRYHQCLTGTKLGCREGDCGACTVLIGTIFKQKVYYQTMTSCLVPLANVQGKHVVTVEGLNLEQLNVVQQAITDEGGTQCGFCTPGFVVSMCGYVLSEKHSYEDGRMAVAGNICRCTGYKSIERAIQQVADRLIDKPQKKSLEWLVEEQFIPAYFLQIANRLSSIQKKYPEPVFNGTTPEFVGGGTDLYVQRPDQMLASKVIPTLLRADLKGIWTKQNRLHLGGSTTKEELNNNPVFQSLDEDMRQHFKLISSLQIRNMATVAGNLVNASPIGDLSIMLLALQSEIVLNDHGSIRSMPLHRFYKGYKTLDKEKTEFVQEINFPLPQGTFHFNFEKVCKRIYLDIASVNTAASISLDDDGTVKSAAISAGGVAAVPKYLEKTSSFLVGKTASEALLQEALDVAQSEVSPISDVRGTVTYKRLLLRQLMQAHFMKFFPELYTH